MSRDADGEEHYGSRNYLLGIECDGAPYHDSRSARDRDRLRQAVLENRGWTIHRVWSADWFQRPAEQLDLIIAKIQSGKEEHDATAVRTARAAPVDIVTIEREDVTEIGFVPVGEESQSSSDAYIEAVLSRPSNWAGELHEAPIGILIALVEEAVRIEGPVHSDEVVSRLRHFADDKRKLLELLEPVSHAAERLDWLKEIAPGRTARAAIQKRYGGSCKACFR
ncbi:DUF3320 domain-containing protein [Methylocystis iwaonis]|uniref:DUF559 domain-containing protein n=1 Tax=Methylocystis iwaonis TaxID=2885079 RepID=A0ABM8E6Y4_9HYPH|nr:DUF3320 domain-containing protein [Methylocystis iwaonis]BDV33719.1 hypothetical protein SS37A_12480 [Methylocystis iwaonis]